MSVETVACSSMQNDSTAIRKSNDVFEKLKVILIEENPSYKEAKAAIDKLERFLEVQTGTYISEVRINNIYPSCES